MDQERMIQLIRSNDASLARRLAALEELHQIGTPKALVAMSHAAFSQSPALKKRAHTLFKEIGFTQCQSIVNLLLEDRVNAYTRKRVFDLLRRYKSRELLRYVMDHADALSEQPERAKLLANWLQQTKLIRQWSKHLLTLPMESAVQFAIAIKKVDVALPISIARIVKNGDPKERLRAMELLSYIAESSAILPFVIGATGSESAVLRSKAVLVLGRFSERISIVEKALTDEDPRVRANAIESLWGVDSEDAHMLLRHATRDGHNRVRANAAKGLYQIGNPFGLQTLQEMINSGDTAMQTSSAWALGEVNAIETIPILRQLLKSPSESVRYHAAHSLEKMGVRLLNMRRNLYQFRDEVFYFAEEDISAVGRFVTAARTLEKLSSAEMTPLVKEVAAVKPEFSHKVLKALKKRCFGRPDVTFLLLALFANDEVLRAKSAAIISCLCQDRMFFDAMLEDDSGDVRVAVVSGLCQNMIAGALELFTSCLIDPEPRVMIVAAQGLYALKDPRGLEILKQKLEDIDPDIRINTIEAIVSGPVKPLTSSVKRLAEKDPERRVRSKAADAVEQLERVEEVSQLRDIRVHIEHIDVASHPELSCYVSVVGESGQVVRDLQRKEVTLEQTGVKHKGYQLEVAPRVIPMEVAILMDYSDSMTDDTIRTMEDGAERIIGQLPEAARVSVIKYAQEAQVVQEPTVERDLLLEAVNLPYEGDTDGLALYDALFGSIGPMLGHNSLRTVVAFVSNNDTCSSQSGMKIMRYAANHHVCVHIIQCGSQASVAKLEALPKGTHGQHWITSKNLPMTTVCRRAADLLSYHYVLTYHAEQDNLMGGIPTLSVEVNHRQFKSRMTVQLRKL